MVNILVACDFSPAAERALGWAAHLQQRLRRAKVVVMHIWNDMAAAGAVPVPPVGPTDEDLLRLAGELRAAVRRHGLDAEILVEVAADPGATIARRAAERGSDLVVMGTQGRGGVTRAVLGGTADWVVPRAPCPVVVMRAK